MKHKDLVLFATIFVLCSCSTKGHCDCQECSNMNQSLPNDSTYSDKIDNYSDTQADDKEKIRTTVFDYYYTKGEYCSLGAVEMDRYQDDTTGFISLKATYGHMYYMTRVLDMPWIFGGHKMSDLEVYDSKISFVVSNTSNRTIDDYNEIVLVDDIDFYRSGEYACYMYDNIDNPTQCSDAPCKSFYFRNLYDYQVPISFLTNNSNGNDIGSLVFSIKVSVSETEIYYTKFASVVYRKENDSSFQFCKHSYEFDEPNTDVSIADWSVNDKWWDALMAINHLED